MWKNILVYVLLLSGSCCIASAQRFAQQVNATMMPSASPSFAFVTIIDTVRPTISPTSLKPTTSPTLVKATPSPFFTSVATRDPTTFSPYPTYDRDNTRPPYPTHLPATASPYYRPYPTYYQPYPTYYKPVSPSYNDDYNNGGETETSQEKNVATSAYVIGAMLLITLIAMCYGRSAFATDLEKEEVATFHENIYKKNWCVLYVPEVFICNKTNLEKKTSFSESLTNKTSYVPVALFFTTRIKILWVRPLAILQFIIGWIACISSIVGFANPDNVLNNNIGAATLFLSELIVHVWYGYLRYWNISWICLEPDEKWIKSLKVARTACTKLYHNDTKERETDLWIIILGHIASVPLHIGSVIGSALACLGITLLAMFGRKAGDLRDNMTLIGVVSAVIGSLAYPILFRRSAVLGKVFASIGHHVCLECYEARHFGKTTKDFLNSIFLKPFGDLISDESDVPDLPNFDKDDAPNKKEKADRNDQNNNDEEALDMSGETHVPESHSEDSDGQPVMEVKSSKTDGIRVSAVDPQGNIQNEFNIESDDENGDDPDEEVADDDEEEFDVETGDADDEETGDDAVETEKDDDDEDEVEIVVEEEK